MNIKKSAIRLSENHPSLLLELKGEKIPDVMGPVLLNSNGFLIDGYRRFQLAENEEMEAFTLKTDQIFEPALELNRRTRSWDDTDYFLWFRWARSLNVKDPNLPNTNFSGELLDVGETILKAIAQRSLQLRQAVLLLNAPGRYQLFFLNMFNTISLNVNETKDFIEMASDLANAKASDIQTVFEVPSLSSVIADNALSPRLKGERLLRELRLLRYPYYYQQLNEFSGIWKELQLDTHFQVKKDQFVQRGILEISLSARSNTDMKEKVSELERTMNSPLWNKVWKKE